MARATTTASMPLIAILALIAAGCSSPTAQGQSDQRVTTGSLSALADAQGRAQAQCLMDAGWDIKVEADGWSGTVPPEQREAYEADDARCNAEVTQAMPVPSIGPDKYRSLYKHQLAMVKCLEAEGYPPRQDPPSEQQFVDDAMRNGGARWSAWNVVDRPADPAALEKKCPQLPPDW